MGEWGRELTAFILYFQLFLRFISTHQCKKKTRKQKTETERTCLVLWVSQGDLAAGESRVFPRALGVLDVFHLRLQLVNVLQHHRGHLLDHLLQLGERHRATGGAWEQTLRKGWPHLLTLPVQLTIQPLAQPSCQLRSSSDAAILCFPSLDRNLFLCYTVFLEQSPFPS